VTKEIKMYDRLELFVTEDPQFNGVYTVRESGDIIIPIVGRIPVEGSSVEEAEKTIKERLERGQLQKATVIVDRLLRWWWFNDNHNRGYGGYVGYGDHDFANSRRGISNGLFGGNDKTSAGDEVSFFLTGKVNSPGQKSLPLPEGRPLGVYEAILMSGGLGRFGDPKKVHIMRMGKGGKRVKVGVDVKKIMEGELADMPIGEGDVIVVPEKVFGF
jgi:protein involved in polysaccharide export with SLBB domain